MIRDARVFVSYTKRDGAITKILLDKLYDNLNEICYPFIHALDNNSHRFQQLRVIKELFRSHIILLLESPLVYNSPWVRLELLLCKIKMVPIIKLNAIELNKILTKHKKSDV